MGRCTITLHVKVKLIFILDCVLSVKLKRKLFYILILIDILVGISTSEYESIHIHYAETTQFNSIILFNHEGLNVKTNKKTCNDRQNGIIFQLIFRS